MSEGKENSSEYGDETEKNSSSNIEYKTDPKTGDLIYEDPKTKTVYVFDRSTNAWKSKVENYDFDGKTYYHTDDNGVKHKWDLEKNEWIKMEEVTKEEKAQSEEESEEDDDTTDEQRKEVHNSTRVEGKGNCLRKNRVINSILLTFTFLNRF